jgi:glycosyltransferase involved in cell wall biosynthesis
MRIVILASFAESLINFRGPLLQAMVQAGHTVIACAPGQNPALEKQLNELGVSYRQISLQRTGLSAVADLYSILSLAHLWRRIRPDCLLSYTIKPVIYGSLAARFAGISRDRVFSMVTGLGSTFAPQSFKERLVSRAIRQLYKAGLAHNNVVFFQNPDDRDFFVDHGLCRPPTRTVIVNGSGVDLAGFPKRPPVLEPVRFLLIARLLKSKGIAEYVEAAKFVRSRYPASQFRLIGPSDSNPEAISAEQIKQWQHGGVIDYAGPVEDVRTELAQASVFVLPSYREGTPRTVLEAMATGRPIITTDAPGCRETVRMGENGFLVPVKDWAALAAAMIKFIEMPELIPTMGERSRLMAETKYDVRKVNAVLLREMGLASREEGRTRTQ